MRVEFEFQGGYGGLFAAEPLRMSVDTEVLDEADGSALVELIRASGLLEESRGGESGGHGPARDTFTYRLRLCDGGRERSFAFDDASVPAAAQPLLRHLRNRAIEEKMSGG